MSQLKLEDKTYAFWKVSQMFHDPNRAKEQTKVLTVEAAITALNIILAMVGPHRGLSRALEELLAGIIIGDNFRRAKR